MIALKRRQNVAYFSARVKRLTIGRLLSLHCYCCNSCCRCFYCYFVVSNLHRRINKYSHEKHTHTHVRMYMYRTQTDEGLIVFSADEDTAWGDYLRFSRHATPLHCFVLPYSRGMAIVEQAQINMRNIYSEFYLTRTVADLY